MALARRNFEEENDKKIFSSLKRSFLPRLPWLFWPHSSWYHFSHWLTCGLWSYVLSVSSYVHTILMFPAPLFIICSTSANYTTLHSITLHKLRFYSHRHLYYIKLINYITLRQDRVLSSTFQLICISNITIRGYITYATDRVVNI
jgi:hypothetical protein